MKQRGIKFVFGIAVDCPKLPNGFSFYGNMKNFAEARRGDGRYLIALNPDRLCRVISDKGERLRVDLQNPILL